MSVPVTQNPAAVDPMKNLTPTQREALLAIDHYRHQRPAGGTIAIGSKKFSRSTIAVLERLALIRMGARSYQPTLAGELAVTRMKRIAGND